MPESFIPRSLLSSRPYTPPDIDRSAPDVKDYGIDPVKLPDRYFSGYATPQGPQAPQYTLLNYAEWADENSRSTEEEGIEDNLDYLDYLRTQAMRQGVYTLQEEQKLRDAALEGLALKGLVERPETEEDARALYEDVFKPRPLNEDKRLSVAMSGLATERDNDAQEARDALSRYHAAKPYLNNPDPNFESDYLAELEEIKAEAQRILEPGNPLYQKALRNHLQQASETGVGGVVELSPDLSFGPVPNPESSFEINEAAIEKYGFEEAVAKSVESGLLSPENLTRVMGLNQKVYGTDVPYWRLMADERAANTIKELSTMENASPGFSSFLSGFFEGLPVDKEDPFSGALFWRNLNFDTEKPLVAVINKYAEHLADVNNGGKGNPKEFTPEREEFMITQLQRTLEEAGQPVPSYESLQRTLIHTATQRGHELGFYDFESEPEDLYKNIRLTPGNPVPIVHPSLYNNKELFEEAVEYHPELNEAQKTKLLDERIAQTELSFVYRDKQLSESEEHSARWAAHKLKGIHDKKKNHEILDEYYADEDNFNEFKDRMVGIGDGIISWIPESLAAVPALFPEMWGHEMASEYLAENARERVKRAQIREAFGIDYGIEQDILETGIPMLLDVVATAALAKITGGMSVAGFALRHGTKFTATGAAKSMVSYAMRDLAKEAPEIAAKKIGIKGLIKDTVDEVSLVRMFEDYNKVQKSALGITSASFINTANRSMAGAYGAMYASLDDSKYTHEQKHAIAKGSALLAGAVEGTITAAFTGMGRAGVEDAFVRGATRKQMKELFARLGKTSDITDVDFNRIVSKQLAEQLAKHGLTVGGLAKRYGVKALDEASEEGIISIANTIVQGMYTGEDVSFSQAFFEAVNSALIGGFYGAAIPGARDAVEGVTTHLEQRSQTTSEKGPSIPSPRAKSALQSAEDSFISSVTAELEKNASPLTAKVMASLLRGGASDRTAGGLTRNELIKALRERSVEDRVKDAAGAPPSGGTPEGPSDRPTPEGPVEGAPGPSPEGPVEGAPGPSPEGPVEGGPAEGVAPDAADAAVGLAEAARRAKSQIIAELSGRETDPDTIGDLDILADWTDLQNQGPSFILDPKALIGNVTKRAAKKLSDPNDYPEVQIVSIRSTKGNYEVGLVDGDGLKYTIPIARVPEDVIVNVFDNVMALRESKKNIAEASDSDTDAAVAAVMGPQGGPAQKASAQKASAQKASAQKASAKKASAQKASAQKGPAQKAPAKKAPTKKTTRNKESPKGDILKEAAAALQTPAEEVTTPAGETTGRVPKVSKTLVESLNRMGVSVHFTTASKLAALTAGHGAEVAINRGVLYGSTRSGLFSTRSGTPRIYILTDRSINSHRTLLHEARHAANAIGKETYPQAHAAAVKALQDSPELRKAAAKKYPGFDKLNPTRQLSEVLSMMADGKLDPQTIPSAIMRFVESVLAALRGSVLVSKVPEISGYFTALSSILEQNSVTPAGGTPAAPTLEGAAIESDAEESSLSVTEVERTTVETGEDSLKAVFILPDGTEIAFTFGSTPDGDDIMVREASSGVDTGTLMAVQDEVFARLEPLGDITSLDDLQRALEGFRDADAPSEIETEEDLEGVAALTEDQAGFLDAIGALDEDIPIIETPNTDPNWSETAKVSGEISQGVADILGAENEKQVDELADTLEDTLRRVRDILTAEKLDSAVENLFAPKALRKKGNLTVASLEEYFGAEAVAEARKKVVGKSTNAKNYQKDHKSKDPLEVVAETLNVLIGIGYPVSFNSKSATFGLPRGGVVSSLGGYSKITALLHESIEDAYPTLLTFKTPATRTVGTEKGAEAELKLTAYAKEAVEDAIDQKTGLENAFEAYQAASDVDKASAWGVVVAATEKKAMSKKLPEQFRAYADTPAFQDYVMRLGEALQDFRTQLGKLKVDSTTPRTGVFDNNPVTVARLVASDIPVFVPKEQRELGKLNPAIKVGSKGYVEKVSNAIMSESGVEEGDAVAAFRAGIQVQRKKAQPEKIYVDDGTSELSEAEKIEDVKKEATKLAPASQVVDFFFTDDGKGFSEEVRKKVIPFEYRAPTSESGTRAVGGGASAGGTTVDRLFVYITNQFVGEKVISLNGDVVYDPPPAAAYLSQRLTPIASRYPGFAENTLADALYTMYESALISAMRAEVDKMAKSKKAPKSPEGLKKAKRQVILNFLPAKASIREARALPGAVEAAEISQQDTVIKFAQALKNRYYDEAGTLLLEGDTADEIIDSFVERVVEPFEVSKNLITKTAVTEASDRAVRKLSKNGGFTLGALIQSISPTVNSEGEDVGGGDFDLFAEEGESTSAVDLTTHSRSDIQDALLNALNDINNKDISEEAKRLEAKDLWAKILLLENLDERDVGILYEKGFRDFVTPAPKEILESLRGIFNVIERYIDAPVEGGGENPIRTWLEIMYGRAVDQSFFPATVAATDKILADRTTLKTGKKGLLSEIKKQERIAIQKADPRYRGGGGSRERLTRGAVERMSTSELLVNLITISESTNDKKWKEDLKSEGYLEKTQEIEAPFGSVANVFGEVSAEGGVEVGYQIPTTLRSFFQLIFGGDTVGVQTIARQIIDSDPSLRTILPTLSPEKAATLVETVADKLQKSVAGAVRPFVARQPNAGFGDRDAAAAAHAIEKIIEAERLPLAEIVSAPRADAGATPPSQPGNRLKNYLEGMHVPEGALPEMREALKKAKDLNREWSALRNRAQKQSSSLAGKPGRKAGDDTTAADGLLLEIEASLGLLDSVVARLETQRQATEMGEALKKAKDLNREWSALRNRAQKQSSSLAGKLKREAEDDARAADGLLRDIETSLGLLDSVVARLETQMQATLEVAATKEVVGPKKSKSGDLAIAAAEKRLAKAASDIDKLTSNANKKLEKAAARGVLRDRIKQREADMAAGTVYNAPSYFNTTQELAEENKNRNDREAEFLGLVSNDPESVLVALQKVVASPKIYSAGYRVLASVLLGNPDFIRSIDFTIVPSAHMSSVAGSYTKLPSGRAQVTLNPYGSNGLGLVSVLLHEYYHAATVEAIANPSSTAQSVAVARLSGILKLAIEAAGKSDTPSSLVLMDGLASLEEFTAHLATSREFQRELKKLTAPGTKRNLFERAWDAILRMFGIAPSNPVYDAAMEAVFDLAFTSVPATATNMASVFRQMALITNGELQNIDRKLRTRSYLRKPVESIADSGGVDESTLQTLFGAIRSLLPDETLLIPSNSEPYAMWVNNGIIYFNPGVLYNTLATFDPEQQVEFLKMGLSEERIHVAVTRALSDTDLLAYAEALSDADYEDTVAFYGAEDSDDPVQSATKMRENLQSSDPEVVKEQKLFLAHERLRSQVQKVLYGETTEEMTSSFRTNEGARKGFIRSLKRQAFDLTEAQRLAKFDPKVRAAISRVVVEVRAASLNYRSLPGEDSVFSVLSPGATIEIYNKQFLGRGGVPLTDEERAEFAEWKGDLGSSDIPPEFQGLLRDLRPIFELLDLPLSYSGDAADPTAFRQLFSGPLDSRLADTTDRKESFLRMITSSLEKFQSDISREVDTAEAEGVDRATLINMIAEASGSTRNLLPSNISNQLDDRLDGLLAEVESGQYLDESTLTKRVEEDIMADAEFNSLPEDSKKLQNRRAKLRAEYVKEDKTSLREQTYEAHNARIRKLESRYRKEAIRKRNRALTKLAAHPEILERVVNLRAMLDGFSAQVKKLFGNSDQMNAHIDAQMGVYITRTYKMFHDPEYVAELTDPANKNYADHEEVRREASKYLLEVWRKEQSDRMLKADPELTPSEVAAQIDTMLTTKEAGSAVSYGQFLLTEFLENYTSPFGDPMTLASSDSFRLITGNLKRRKDLPEPLQNLLGIYGEEYGEQLLVRAISNVAALVANQNMLVQTRDLGLTNGWFLTKEDHKQLREKDPEGAKKFRPIGVKGGSKSKRNPLQGLYAPAHMVEAIDNLGSPAQNTLARGVSERTMRAGMEAINMATGKVMGIKTLGSGGHFLRNALSMPILAMSQGYPLGLIPEMTAQFFRHEARTVFSRDVQAKWLNMDIDLEREELVGLGILHDSVRANTLRDMLSMGTEKALEGLQKERQKIVTEMAASGWGKAKAVGKALIRLEEAMDSMYKVPYYRVTLQMMREAKESGLGKINGVDVADMSDYDLKRAAAKTVLRTAPSYSQTLPMVEAFSKSPASNIISPFVRWKSEMWRTTVGTFQVAREEIESGNPVLKRRGIARITGMFIVNSASVALPMMSAFLLAGIGFEEDEAIRETLPEFAKNNSQFYYNSDGQLKYIDLTFTNPFSFLADGVSRTLGSLMLGDYAGATKNAIWVTFLEPFADDQILFSAWRNWRENNDPVTGMPIYDELDTPGDSFFKQLKFVSKEAIAPRILLDSINAFNAGRAPATTEEYTPFNLFMKGFYPFREQTVDFERSYSRFIYADQKRRAAVAAEKGVLAGRKPMSEGDVRKLYNTANNKLLKANEKLMKITTTFENMGVDPNVLYKIQTSAGIGKRNAALLRRGYMERTSLTPEFRNRMMRLPWGPERLQWWEDEMRGTDRVIQVW